MEISQIETEVLSLPVEQRACLVHRLLLSLDEPTEVEFDRLWGVESARRAVEFDLGNFQATPGDKVAAKVKGHDSGATKSSMGFHQVRID